MEVGDLISEFRTVTGDHGTPPLWGDKSLIAWANEAQREAAIRAKLLRDVEGEPLRDPWLVPFRSGRRLKAWSPDHALPAP